MKKTIQKKSSEVVNIDQITSYLKSFGNKLKEHHREQFVNIAMSFKLNPFKREIYGIQYGENFNIIVGYEVYLKRAELSGQLSGWSVVAKKGESDTKAICTIRRKDWQHPLVHEVFMSEYHQNNGIWKSKPITMIKKVAIAQAFRLAFPCDLGGVPYIEEEINLKDKAVNGNFQEAEIVQQGITNENLQKGIDKLTSGDISKEEFEAIIAKYELTEEQEKILLEINKKIA